PAVDPPRVAKRFELPARRLRRSGLRAARSRERRPDHPRSTLAAGARLEPAHLRRIAGTERQAGARYRAVRRSGRMSRQRVLFIDRDGTLIVEPADQQVDSLEKFQLVPGVIPALCALRDAGYTFVMVSNQDGLGTASFPE